MANTRIQFDRIQTISVSKLLGVGAGGTDLEEITLGTNLSFTGSTLNASGGGTPGGSTTEIQWNNASSFDGISTFTTDGTDITGTGLLNLSGGTLRVPVSATPTLATNGDLAFDTTITDFTTGVLKFYGNEEQGIVSMPIAQFTTPTDGHVVTYDATNDEFVLAAGGGGLTNWTDGFSSATQATSSLTATNAASDVNAAIVAKGNGALVTTVPDGTATGGNSRGTKAIDLQMQRSSASMVAAANYSTISGGLNNQITSGTGATIGGGGSNTISWNGSASYDTIGGGLSNTIASSNGYSTIGGGNNNSVSSFRSYTTIAGGRSNNTNGDYATVSGGFTNTASATNSIVAGGRYGVASIYGQFAHASGEFASQGDAQRHTLQMRRSITGTSATELFADGSSTRWVLTANTVWTGILHISAITTSVGNGSGTVGDAIGTSYKVTIKRIGTSTALVGTVQEIGTTNSDASMSTSVFTIDADDTNEALRIQFTPPSATAGSTSVYRVHAVFDGNQLGY